jgi:hypothetical protein
MFPLINCQMYSSTWFCTGLYHFELLIYASFGKPGLSLHWSLRDDVSSGPVVLGPGGMAGGSVRAVERVLPSSTDAEFHFHYFGRDSRVGGCGRILRFCYFLFSVGFLCVSRNLVLTAIFLAFQEPSGMLG